MAVLRMRCQAATLLAGATRSPKLQLSVAALRMRRREHQLNRNYLWPCYACGAKPQVSTREPLYLPNCNHRWPCYACMAEISKSSRGNVFGTRCPPHTNPRDFPQEASASRRIVSINVSRSLCDMGRMLKPQPSTRNLRWPRYACYGKHHLLRVRATRFPKP